MKLLATFIFSFAVLGFASPSQGSALNVKPINWTKPENKKAKQFRSAIDESLRNTDLVNQSIAAKKFILLSVGCGTLCQSIILVDYQRGIAHVPGITASYGVSFSINSRLLVLNPKENWQDEFSDSDKPDWLTEETYVILDSGEVVALKLN